jgi:hypothetical protein
MGAFPVALKRFVAAYSGLDLVRVVTYDAGACSLENANLVRQHHLHYVFGLTAGQPTLFAAARLWLGTRSADQAEATSTDVASGKTIIRRLYLGAAIDAPEGMLVIALLRRIAYTLLTLFHSVTQRSEERRAIPWNVLLQDIYAALLTATDAQLAGLRSRPRAAPS